MPHTREDQSHVLMHIGSLWGWRKNLVQSRTIYISVKVAASGYSKGDE